MTEWGTTIDLELSLPELRHAGYVGIDRYVRALSQHRRPAFGIDHNDYGAHVLGAMGEKVIAKWLGAYWTGDLGEPDRGAPDVGRFHVRTRPTAAGELIIRDGDRDDEPYVLVVPGRLPRFRIVGYCYGRDGKRPDYSSGSSERPPCYFVPHAALRPVTELEARP